MTPLEIQLSINSPNNFELVSEVSQVAAICSRYHLIRFKISAPSVNCFFDGETVINLSFNSGVTVSSEATKANSSNRLIKTSYSGKEFSFLLVVASEAVLSVCSSPKTKLLPRVMAKSPEIIKFLLLFLNIVHILTILRFDFN